MQGYYALKMGKPDVQQHFAKAVAAYEAAMKLKPDYPQVALSLIELHVQSPANAGADQRRAQQLAQQAARVTRIMTLRRVLCWPLRPRHLAILRAVGCIGRSQLASSLQSSFLENSDSFRRSVQPSCRSHAMSLAFHRNFCDVPVLVKTDADDIVRNVTGK
jgi:hypothetical protein